LPDLSDFSIAELSEYENKKLIPTGERLDIAVSLAFIHDVPEFIGI